MSEEFLKWWKEHYDMAHLAMSAASDAWDAATAAERERCAQISRQYSTKLWDDPMEIAAMIRLPTPSEKDKDDGR